MSWLGLLMVGWALTDLVFSVRPSRIVPECVGAITVILLGLLCGFTEPVSALALVVIAVGIVGWGQTVTRGFARRQPWLPLAWCASWLVVAVAAAPWSPRTAGAFAEWWAAVPWGGWGDWSPERGLLVLGLLLAQLSTGNVLVRLVLAATHTANPLRGREIDTQQLKGGRLIGPLERLFILGLGLAGELTAAGIVVAAKGLIRFPELQAARTADAEGEGAHLHAVTEYFLLGSFVSWLLPLASLALVAG